MSGKRGKGWSEAEVGHLCLAWLQVSEDATVGTGQKAKVFWSRVCQALAIRLEVAGMPAIDKNWHHAQVKFGAILRNVSLFAAKYQQVINLDESGKTVADRLLDAQQLYAQATNNDPAKRTSFKYMNCYTILKDAPKWNTLHTGKKPVNIVSNIVVADHSSLSGTTDIEEVAMSSPSTTASLLRPMGNKRAKGERNQISVMDRNAKAGEDLVETMKRKSEAMELHFKAQVSQQERAQAQKQQIAEEKNMLKTIALLLHHDPNSEVAKDLLKAQAQVALKRLQTTAVELNNKTTKTTETNEELVEEEI